MSTFAQMDSKLGSTHSQNGGNSDIHHVERQTSSHNKHLTLTRKNFKTKCHPRQWIHVISSHVGLILLFLGYVIFGAFVFKAIEAPWELEERRQLVAKRERLIDTLWNISAYTNSRINGTQMIQSYLSEWEDTLFNSPSVSIEGEPHWSFTGALFFSSATITTIGYGNIAPVTILGRVLCIFYAFMGVPLTLLVLTDIGALLARWGKICAILTMRKVKEREKKTKEKATKATPTITVEDLGNKSFPNLRRTVSTTNTQYAAVSQDTTDGIPNMRMPEPRSGFATDDSVKMTNGKKLPGSRNALPHRTWDRLMRDSAFTVEISRSEPDLRSDPSDGVKVSRMREKREQDFPPPRLDRDRETGHDSDSTMNDSMCDSRRASGQFLEVFNKSGLCVSQESVQSDESKSSHSMSNVILVPEPLANTRSKMTMTRGTKSNVIVTNDATARFGVKESEIATFQFPVWLAVCILLLYLGIGGFAFSLIEKWKFFESFYFCFISLSTIGFGDVIPENKGTILTLSIAYAVLGLALTSMCISLASTAIMNSLRRLGQLTDYYKTRQWKNVHVYRSLYVRGRSLRRRFSSRRKGKAGQFSSLKRRPKRGSSLRLPGKFAIVRMGTPNTSQELS
ncbi:uncharacterized protein LOC144452128 [Glandiceps talaboti]